MCAYAHTYMHVQMYKLHTLFQKHVRESCLCLRLLPLEVQVLPFVITIKNIKFMSKTSMTSAQLLKNCFRKTVALESVTLAFLVIFSIRHNVAGRNLFISIPNSYSHVSISQKYLPNTHCCKKKKKKGFTPFSRCCRV